MRNSRAKFAGLLPPSTLPEFKIERSPIWQENNRVSGVANSEADPAFRSNATQRPVYHYQTNGNAYLRQIFNAEMKFEKTAASGTAAAADVFAFKALIKPHVINGRRLIYSTKNALKSGGIFVDMVDGHVRIGWYDTNQKREVWIGTDVPVLDPYHWHYLYVRKRFPDITLGSGCWRDTLFSQTAALMNDVLLVRRFRKAAASTIAKLPWDYKPSATVRNFIGFTTDLEHVVADSSGRGLASRNDRTYTGNAAGQVTASAAVFSADHLGMYFNPGTGPHQGEAYRISTFTSSTIINVVDPVTGAAPDLSAMIADPGGVYSGVRLVKSEGFETAENVDQTTFDLELFGSHLARDPESGILPYDGEFASFAYIIESGATPPLFEPINSGVFGNLAAELADEGTDLFGNVEIYDASATEVGMLRSNEAAVDAFTAVDTKTHAPADSTSSLPNEKLEVTVNTSASSTAALPLIWDFLHMPAKLDLRRSVRIAFYDPEQAIISNPGDELVIQPGGDDGSNPSGQISITLSKLPISRDAGPILTRVYMTQPLGGVYHLVAEAQFGTSSLVVSKNDDEIARGVVLDFDNWPPPECDVIEVVGETLACGNLRNLVNSDQGEPADFPDVVIYSKPFVPTSFPATNLISVADGSRAGVTALREFNGRLVIAKRDSMWRAVLRQGLPSTETISPKIGAASGAAMVLQNNMLFFWGKQGIYLYSGAGIPELVSEGLRTLFVEGGVEPGAALYSVGAVHPKYSQVFLTLREANALYTSHRVSMDIGPNGARFSRYEGPNLTALGDLSTEKAESGELVGGTEEGFFVWLDRRDSSRLMLGAAATHGASALTIGVGSTTTRIVISAGVLDTTLAGARGAVLRFGTTEAVVLLAESGALHLDRPVSLAPASGTAATLGAPTRYWETRWLDFDIPEATKRNRYLDVIFTPGSGTVTCTAFIDFGTTAIPLASRPNPTATTIDLATSSSGEDVGPGFRTFEINHLHCRFVKFRFASSDPFEIIDLVVRLSDADAQ